MDDQKIYDIIGIGIGPFNLGLAALAHELPELTGLFFDSKPAFDWHPGMLIPGTRMQVPYYADLVTLANPQSPFSWFAYLHATKRMFRFATLEEHYPTRKQYVDYCSWVAGQLDTLQFNARCEHITYGKRDKCYEVTICHTASKKQEVYHTKNLVLGIGSVPYLPKAVAQLPAAHVFHASQYVFRKTALLLCKNITLIGAGQSAAEIFLDLLNHSDLIETLHWFTRSERLMPMDTGISAAEMSTPAYIDFFYALPAEKKTAILKRQDMLYKGINPELIKAIFIKLDELNNPNIKIHPGMELKKATPGITLELVHRASRKKVIHQTKGLILATGYEQQIPAFLTHLKHHMQWTPNGWYEIDRNYKVTGTNALFVQHADLYSHGFNAADLSLGPYRNAVILNSILGREHFKIEKGTPFQRFEGM